MIKRNELEVAISEVAGHYKGYHKRWNLKPKERKILIELLGCGYTAEDLCLAIDGLHLDDWHRGKNPDNKKWLAFKEHSIQDYIEEAEKAKKVAESRVQLAKDEKQEKKKEKEEHLKLREKMAGQPSTYRQFRDRVCELSSN